MEDTAEEQQDLFIGSKEETGPERIKALIRSRRDPSFTVSLELLTAFLAVMVVLLVIFFYLGFIRGESVHRAEVSHKIREIKMLKQKQIPPDPPSTAQSASLTYPEKLKSAGGLAGVKTVANPSAKPYTIQVVAYRNEQRALREVSRIYQKGYASRLIKEGNFFVVCVGEFKSKGEASRDFEELKQEYKDCFLRKF